MRTIVIVGDKFREFAGQDSVLCVSEAELLLASDGARLDDVEFVLGQGVSPERVERLLVAASTRGVREKLRFEPLEKCGRRHIHKHQPENSVISLPRRIAADRFEAELCIDDAGEMLSDHAGRHLPGMVLIEAARQICLAVTEEYFASAYVNGVAFLWTSITMRFLGYAFPKRLDIVYRIGEHTKKGTKSDVFAVEVEFFQAGSTVASASLGFEIRDKTSVERLEARLASAAAGAAA